MTGRLITDDDAKAIADALISGLTEEETLDRIFEIGLRQVDRHVGQGIRRALFWVAVPLIIWLGWKIDPAHITNLFKG